MFMTISIKKIKPKFNELSVNLLKYFDHVQMGARRVARVNRPSPPPPPFYEE